MENYHEQAKASSYFQNFRLEREHFESHSHELLTPVLVVWGKYDRFISIKLGHEIAQRLPNATLQVIDKSGHYVHMDTPRELAQAMTTFLGNGIQAQALVLRLRV